MSIKADGDVFDVTEAGTEESSVPLRSLPQHPTGEIPEGLPVSSGRGMYEERHTGTRETPTFQRTTKASAYRLRLWLPLNSSFGGLNAIWSHFKGLIVYNPKKNTIYELNLEMQDIDIFNIPDTKTRIATVQNYFFPRLEILMHATMNLIQEVYGVNPYEKMTFVYYPSNRKKSLESRDFYNVHIGLSGKRRTDRELKYKRRDGKPFRFHPTYLTYNIYFEGSLRVEFLPFRQYVSSEFIAAVADLYNKNYAVLSTIFGLQQISHERAYQFVKLRDVFTGEKEVINGTLLFSPLHYFPVNYERGLWNSMLSFTALYPLLEAFNSLGEGETPELSQKLAKFKDWFMADTSEESEYETDFRNERDGNETPMVLPELDSYTFVRAGMWWSVLARDNWTCCSCGRTAKEEGVTLEVDHITPRSKGGTDEMRNLQTLCKKCNIGKSNKDATDLRRNIE